MTHPSILARVRSEAYNDGYGQARQVSYDDAFNRGYVRGRAEGEDSCGRWWGFGLLCGIGLSALGYAFL